MTDAMAKITAPEPGYTGTGPGGVEFTDGVAEVDLSTQDKRAALAGPMAYYRDAGYGIDGSDPEQPAAVVPTDPRGVRDQLQGGPLRDAAVDPRGRDFLPPTNAGEPGELGNPHGPHVVAPGIHGARGPVPPLPGPVSDDPNVQQARETEAARRILVDGEPVPDVAGVDPDADFRADQPDAGRAPASDVHPEGTDAGPPADADRDPGDDGEPEQVDPPAHSARKAEWVDHAVALGADRAEAEQLTVRELVAKYDHPAPAAG